MLFHAPDHKVRAIVGSMKWSAPEKGVVVAVRCGDSNCARWSVPAAGFSTEDACMSDVFGDARAETLSAYSRHGSITVYVYQAADVGDWQARYARWEESVGRAQREQKAVQDTARDHAHAFRQSCRAPGIHILHPRDVKGYCRGEITVVPAAGETIPLEVVQVRLAELGLRLSGDLPFGVEQMGYTSYTNQFVELVDPDGGV